jgi:hypothetical protein
VFEPPYQRFTGPLKLNFGKPRLDKNEENEKPPKEVHQKTERVEVIGISHRVKFKGKEKNFKVIGFL